MGQTLSESMSLNEYIQKEETYIKIKVIIYKANQKLSVLQSHKRTGELLFVSSESLDQDIKKWTYIESRLKQYAQNKAINLLINI